MSELDEMSCLPVVVTQDEIVLCGMAVRTSNFVEQDAETQKIAPLWQRFMGCPEAQNNTRLPIYGCYFDYESDQHGDYTVMLGLPLSDSANLTKLTLRTGNYLKFSAEGEMPAVVIDLWGEVWRYFADKNCQYTRIFGTDYERYTSTEGVDIYIGIKKGCLID